MWFSDVTVVDGINQFVSQVCRAYGCRRKRKWNANNAAIAHHLSACVSSQQKQQLLHMLRMQLQPAVSVRVIRIFATGVHRRLCSVLTLFVWIASIADKLFFWSLVLSTFAEEPT